MNRRDLVLWPCSTCGAPGVKNVAALGMCSTHYSAFLRTLSPAVFQMTGMLVETVFLFSEGTARPDHGPSFAECECVACGATLVAVVGSACPYCATARERLAQWQADLTLTPPDVDQHDRTYDAQMKAWVRRLATAVEAGIVTGDQARRAVERTERRHVIAA